MEGAEAYELPGPDVGEAMHQQQETVAAAVEETVAAAVEETVATAAVEEMEQQETAAAVE